MVYYFSKLKNCPFCGSTRVEYDSGWPFGCLENAAANGIAEEKLLKRTPVICCDDCGISFNLGSYGFSISDYRTKELLFNAWNQRPEVKQEKNNENHKDKSQGEETPNR